ncbi:uncharacterized protein EI90DRAFT_3030791 [Cantharellus anzutake]|uniref:uncharacterized protein n=1 Tax=Cantharellus anzutake TaxID=1750568 RepID=UPI00190611D6|nr:uncharacterized protein EI90DRAFT_3030791 [Cantharellus anzutake]KAF8342946.1 hypothetical protein EI90DRAFT_3030791 [Cantharellus anzutake]
MSGHPWVRCAHQCVTPAEDNYVTPLAGANSNAVGGSLLYSPFQMLQDHNEDNDSGLGDDFSFVFTSGVTPRSSSSMEDRWNAFFDDELSYISSNSSGSRFSFLSSTSTPATSRPTSIIRDLPSESLDHKAAGMRVFGSFEEDVCDSCTASVCSLSGTTSNTIAPTAPFSSLHAPIFQSDIAIADIHKHAGTFYFPPSTPEPSTSRSILRYLKTKKMKKGSPPVTDEKRKMHCICGSPLCAEMWLLERKHEGPGDHYATNNAPSTAGLVQATGPAVLIAPPDSDGTPVYRPSASHLALRHSKSSLKLDAETHFAPSSPQNSQSPNSSASSSLGKKRRFLHALRAKLAEGTPSALTPTQSKDILKHPKFTGKEKNGGLKEPEPLSPGELDEERLSISWMTRETRQKAAEKMERARVAQERVRKRILEQNIRRYSFAGTWVPAL